LNQRQQDDTMIKKLPIHHYLPNASQLVFGCMGLSDWSDNPATLTQQSHSEAAINTALEAGINVFDHADIYCKGKSESIFGKLLDHQPSLRDQLYLQSKVGIRPATNGLVGRYDFSKEWLLHSIEQSLSRLNTDYLDVYFLHRPDPLMEPEAVADVFHHLQNSGKVKHFAVSNMQQHQMAFLQSALTQPLIANQIEMSLHKRDWLEEGVLAGQTEGSNVNFSAGTLEYCRKNTVQLQAWGSLAQGIYCGNNTSKPTTEAVLATTKLVSQLAKDYQVSQEAIVLAWLQRHPAHIQPVIGSVNLQRIQACAQAATVELSREHWYALYISARGIALP
jgi:predicted oxidoreductase